MKIIKLTSVVDGKAIYINVKHLIAFDESGSRIWFALTNKGNFGHVKETPEEIVNLIKNAEEI